MYTMPGYLGLLGTSYPATALGEVFEHWTPGHLGQMEVFVDMTASLASKDPNNRVLV